MTAPHAESYTNQRVVLVIGSLVALYFVHALAGWLLPIMQAPVDAAAGYAIGVLVHKYWGS
jgi:hypothetical protein